MQKLLRTLLITAFAAASACPVQALYHCKASGTSAVSSCACAAQGPADQAACPGCGKSCCAPAAGGRTKNSSPVAGTSSSMKEPCCSVSYAKTLPDGIVLQHDSAWKDAAGASDFATPLFAAAVPSPSLAPHSWARDGPPRWLETSPPPIFLLCCRLLN
jgi:hypothetical protein